MNLIPKIINCFVFTSLFIAITAEAVCSEPYFSHITTQNGLSSNIVYSLFKDHRGYLWIGCENGLNRYDGYKIVSFRHNPMDSTSLCNGAVTGMAEDADGNFWIATSNGACRFDYATESFSTVFNAEQRNTFCRNFYLTRKKEFFLITAKGIYLYRKENKQFSKYFPSAIDDSSTLMLDTEDNHLIIGTWGRGVLVISPDRQDYKLKKMPSEYNDVQVNTIESATPDANGLIYFATQMGVMTGRIIDEQGRPDIELKQILHYSLSSKGLTNDMVHSILRIENDKFWIGTEYGLNIVDRHTGIVQKVYYQDNNIGSLSNNLITCLYKGKDDEIWIGTYQGGVNLFSPGNVRFNDKLPAINHSIQKGMRYVKSIHQQSDGTLWIGTDYGLLAYSADLTLQKTFTHSADERSLEEGGVTAIFTDSNEDLWIGNWGGGVNFLNKQSNAFIHYNKIAGSNTQDSTFAGDWNVRSFAEDSSGCIWIAYMFGILDKFDPATKTFLHFNLASQIGRPNLIVRSMQIDNQGNLWIGATGAGLIKFDIHNNQVKLYAPELHPQESITSPPSIDIYSVFIESETRIWLGTGCGISAMNPESETFVNYSFSPDLTPETILSIITDNRHTVWFSTLNGIARFDPATGIYVNYNVSDGILPNAEVVFKNSSGHIYFGGVNGITLFHPDSIWTNTAKPPVVFTDFKIFNRSVLYNKDILPLHMNELSGIDLRYDQNDVLIEFSALSLVHPQKNTYAYKLEGFDNDWIFSGTTREAKYTNLDPGSYTFKIKAANSDGIWSNTERAMTIVIHPPWWATLFFKILFVLLFIGSIILFVYLRTYSLKQQRKKLILRVRERTSEIEKQQVTLIQQAIELKKSNTLLLEKQEEIHAQKESIEIQNLKLEHKNILLEEQKDQLLEQKLQVEEMAERLHQIDQMKLKFFTNISHEFRTPLSLIIGPLEKTLTDLQEDENETILNRLQIVYRNTLRLLRLINQFLDLSKIEEGAMKLKIARGEIRKYLEGIVEAYHYVAEQKSISLVFQAEHEIECYFDNDKIDKIVYNLLSNSFKYTDNKGRILVSLDKDTLQSKTGSEIPAIRISVEDNGRGIDEKHKMKIFERFYQAEEDGTSNSGTGIGLSLAHELIKIYRGTIHVESTPGYGSRFIVTLPCNKDSFNENEIVREQFLDTTLFRNIQMENMVSDTGKTGFTEQVETNDKPLVLIVEDNIDTLTHLREQLSPKFNLHVALDGNAGWNKAINLVPEAIISDVMMPSINGFQLCEKLKNDDRTCHIPVILLTALADRTDQMEGFECGADEYIIKPFDMDLLKVKVRNLIENREKLKHFFRKAVMYPPPDISIDSADDKLMRRVMKALNEEISNPDFGVDELSKRVGLSRTHLYRKLLKITSQSPVELIRNTRLQRAAQLLRENKLYVAEVVYMSGFKEISYFRKMFKDFYGLSPVEYSQSAKLV